MNLAKFLLLSNANQIQNLKQNNKFISQIFNSLFKNRMILLVGMILS